MSEQASSVSFTLPSWIDVYIHDIDTISDIEARMAFVIEASRQNVIHKTGGPFAAAIFEKKSGKLISLGVNIVATQNLSVLHAEIVAIMLAQRHLGTYDLGSCDLAEHELVISAEPCAMCLGAIPWSGVCRVISAASDSDVRAIGFDEGPKVNNYKAALQDRNIDVIVKLQRHNAVEVLQWYWNHDGIIYNSKNIHVKKGNS